MAVRQPRTNSEVYVTCNETVCEAANPLTIGTNWR